MYQVCVYATFVGLFRNLYDCQGMCGMTTVVLKSCANLARRRTIGHPAYVCKHVCVKK